MKKLLSIYFLFLVNSFSVVFSNQQMPTTNIEILQAAQEGNLEAFEHLIKNKKNVNIQDEKGNTPLHIAAKEGHALIVELLTKYDEPQGYLDKIWQFFFGSKSPDINAQNNDGDTPTHCAAECDDIQGLIFLICKKPDLSIKNKKYYTALLLASEKERIENTLFLIRMDDDYYKRTINGDTVLQVAFNKSNSVFAKKIIVENNFLSQHCPIKSGSNALMKAKNILEETPLLYCARTNNSEMVDILLENGASVVIDTPDKKERMPISYACYNNNLQMITALAKNNATVNKSTIADAMPVHIALNNNNYPLALHLLTVGADINAQDIRYGNTPLLVATEGNEEHKIKWLVSHKADITKRNKQGMDILDVAIVKKHKNLAPLFKTYGISIDSEDQQGRTRLMNIFATGNNDMIEPLIALQANINHRDKENNTVLHLATQGNNLTGAKIALQHNQNLIYEKNQYGNTPLHWAADSVQSSDFVEWYIAHNAEVNVQNVYGETPLHRAVAAGNKKTIELLKKNKASLYLVTTKNNSLALYALIHDKYDCLPLVLDAQTINISNTDGKTTMSLAIEKKLSLNLLQKIIDCGTNIAMPLPGEKGYSYVHHAIVYYNNEALEALAIPSLINKENNDRTTPLSYAVQKKNRWAVKFLLYKRAMLNVSDNNGWTEMHHAAAADDDYIFDMLPFSEMSYTKRTNKGDTPLHIAAQHDRVNNIKKILSKDNNRSRKNDNGETPVITAAFNGRLHAVQALLQESDFMDGTVETMIRSISSAHIRFHLASVQTYLEKELEQWDNECNAVVIVQNKIQNLLQINQINNSLLKQKAVKEYAHKAYAYNSSSKPSSYNFEELKKMPRSERQRHTTFLQHIMQKEQKEGDVLHKNIEDINLHQKEVASKLKEATVQAQTISTSSDRAQLVDEKQEEEPECDVCNENKQDAQHRCTCVQCDKKICFACIKAWQEKGKSTCPYCFNELKK